MRLGYLTVVSDVVEDELIDDAAEARSAVHVGLYVSAVRCLLTYVVAPVMGLAGPLLGAAGFVLQILGSIVAVAGAQRLWHLGHRARVPYALVAGITAVMSATLIFELLRGIFR